MNEEQLLKRKIIDTANQAFNHNIYTYTNFLSINELSSVNKMCNELSFIPYDDMCSLCLDWNWYGKLMFIIM